MVFDRQRKVRFFHKIFVEATLFMYTSLFTDNAMTKGALFARQISKRNNYT